MRNIVLTGFMGTGKTEVGKILAVRLGYSLIDADSEIEREQGVTITEIFQRSGEAGFRDIEADVIRRLSERERTVISTGGGAVLRQENMDNLRKKGVIVCLTASAEAIYNRICTDTGRPLLQVEDPKAKISELLAFRKPFYEKADIMIDTEGKTPGEVAEEIMAKSAEVEK
ncbi:MAG: shikimate kinase [Thermodesulfovibrionales bacterium]|jgi:shikimate kinase